MNKQVTQKGFVEFLRKYAYIFLLSAALITVAIVLTLTLQDNGDGKGPVTAPPVTFYSPVLNATVAKGYSDSSLVYNSTLKQWEAHKAVTFTTSTSSDVFAVLKGTVKEVYTNYLDGTVIVLQHANNLTSVYGSLDNNVTLKAGDTVERGDVLGRTSSTAHSEYELGNHLRFQLLENDVKVDPSSYLNLENK